LPAEGPGVPAPPWPLDKQTPAEKKRWEQVWSLPQAAAWHALSVDLVVARWVRLALRAERPGEHGAGVTFQSEVRKLEHDLGLTPRAMHILNWRIVDTPVPSDSVSDLEAYRRAVGDDPVQ
jgi:hypothetical protein